MNGETQNNPPDNKTCNRNSHRQCVANITGAVPKTGFKFVFLLTYRAMRVHIQHVTQFYFFVWVLIHKKIPLSAPWAFKAKKTGKIALNKFLFFTHARKGNSFLIFEV